MLSYPCVGNANHQIYKGGSDVRQEVERIRLSWYTLKRSFLPNYCQLIIYLVRLKLNYYADTLLSVPGIAPLEARRPQTTVTFNRAYSSSGV